MKVYKIAATRPNKIQNRCDKDMLQQTRKIKPTRRSVSGIYPFRNDASVPYESTLERDFLIRTEFFLDVLDVIAQPVQIPFVGLNGNTYTYTPDYLVYHRLGTRNYDEYPRPLLVEVKPEAAWRESWRSWLPKWKAARRYAHLQGWQFHIHDESRIRDQVFMNISFLEQYRRMNFPSEESQDVIESVQEMGSAPIHYILARHFMGLYRAQGIAHIWHLIATRRLDCDVSIGLNEFSEVWIPAYVY